jgi:hypothetical protein
MQTKGLLLQLRRLWLVVIIEPGLANGHHTRMVQLTQQPVQRRRSARLKIQRVHAHRAIDIGVTLSQTFNLRSIVSTNPDAEEMTNAARARSIECRIERTAMGGEIETVKVTVGINQHGNNHLRIGSIEKLPQYGE